MRQGDVVDGRFVLVEDLAPGDAHRRVWVARDRNLRRRVVLKDAGGASEPLAMAMTPHPHVVVVHEHLRIAGGRADAGNWVVMEYAAGGSLAGRRMSPRAAARIAAQVADALAYLHRNGLVHCDIKPGNIVLTESGTAKLTDFGSAYRSQPTGTPQPGNRHTPVYASDEHAAGVRTPAADVYSLAATVYDLVMGERSSPYRPFPHDLLGPLNDVLPAMLAPDPGRRPDAMQAQSIFNAIADGRDPHLLPAHEQPTEDPPGAEAPADVMAPADVKAPADVTAPAGARRRGPALAYGAGVLGVVLLVAASIVWLVAPDEPVGAAGRGGTQDRQGTQDTQAGPVLGDPATADPCALLSVRVLARFGDTELDRAYGNFNRCDVLVHPRSGGEVDVRAELLNPDPELEPAGPVAKVNGIDVVREAEEDGACRRTLLLRDKTRVDIDAEVTEDGPDALCAIADAAVTSATAVLSHGPPPRRSPRPVARSLIWSDACALVEARALDRLPSMDARNPEVGFGNWECEWESTTTDYDLLVRFDQHSPLTGDEGTPWQTGGRRAAVEPDGYGADSCVVWVPHREFTLGGSEKAEFLIVVVMGRGQAAERCRLAKAIAAPAAANLPS